jgi:hypothetical protein
LITGNHDRRYIWSTSQTNNPVSTAATARLGLVGCLDRAECRKLPRTDVFGVDQLNPICPWRGRATCTSAPATAPRVPRAVRRPRDRYGDNNTRISRLPFPQIRTSAHDSAATVSPQAPSSSPDGGAQREAQPAARFAGLAPFNSFRSSRKVLAHFSMSFSKTWRRITLIRRALLRGESFMAPRMRSLRPLMS